jgi:hypothetical protein
MMNRLIEVRGERGSMDQNMLKQDKLCKIVIMSAINKIGTWIVDLGILSNGK